MIEIRHRIGGTVGLALLCLLFSAGCLVMLLGGDNGIRMGPRNLFAGLLFGAGGAAVVRRYVTPRAAVLGGLATTAVVGAMFASPSLVLPLAGLLLFGVGGVLGVHQRLTQPVAMRLDSNGVTWQPGAFRALVTAPWTAVDGFVHERMHSNNVVVVLGDPGRVIEPVARGGIRDGVLAFVVVGQGRETVARFVAEANVLLGRHTD